MLDAQCPDCRSGGHRYRRGALHRAWRILPMNLILLGVSHRTAPVELRERLDFSSGNVGDAVQELATRAAVPECVVLSTCNRSEIYVGGSDTGRTREDVIAFLSEFHRLPPEHFLPHLFTLEGRDVVTHLFRVAAGLDSVVVGEPQILGQVKEAFQAAHQQRCVGPLMERLFTSSFGVGKRVRSETAIGEGAVSVSFEAVAIARKIFERLDGRKVLVVGAGDISKLTAQHLRTSGVGEIIITSRTAAHADALAASVKGRAVPWRDMMTALGEADIVITATGAPRHIITRADVVAVTSRRRSDPLYIIDIAVPRDVEPSVGDIEQVFLYNIDDLQKFVQKNVSNRGAEVGRAEAIVADEVTRFDRVAAVPQDRAHDCGLAQALLLDSRVGASEARGQARRPVAGSARAVRGSHPSHHREAAARSHGTAQTSSGRGNAGRLHRRDQPAVPPAGSGSRASARHSSHELEVEVGMGMRCAP